MVEVDVWADVRCPWCWIGSRRLCRAAARLGEPVRIRYRSFLLEPDGPASPGLTTAQVATTEWGLSAAGWESKSRHFTAEGLNEDLDLQVDGALMFDSAPVHRLLKLATAATEADPTMVWDAVFAAHFTTNEDLGDPSVLTELAKGWGLGEREIERALAGGPFTTEVDSDLAEAHRLRIVSVPTLVAASGDRTSGTSPVGALTEFLATAGATQ